MFTIRRRLLAVTALAALALAQIWPASATSDFMSYGYCHGMGNSTKASTSSAYTENQTSSSYCWLYLQMNWYDPVSGDYIAKAPKGGTLYAGGYYYDSIGINTSLNTYHQVGTGPGTYDPGFTYA